jgi:glucose/arabinose dehydrogenase
MAIMLRGASRPWLVAAGLLLCLPAGAQDKGDPGRVIDVEDFDLPDGYRIEALVANLSIPTTAIFDGPDLLIAESGFKNTAAPRVLRVRPDGSVTIVAQAGLQAPVTGLLAHDGSVYVSHRGRVSLVGGDGTLRDLLTGLRSDGDHQNNQIVMGPDGFIYMGQGSVTNSGVVGVDNHVFGWLARHPQLQEAPCRDVVLTGDSYETDDPLQPGKKATTGAYKPYRTPATPGETVKGERSCGGSIVRFRPDGSGLEVVAWGMRNPFGLAFDQGGALWATWHGADVRGSRPIFNDPDYLARVEPGAWYGWPDFFDGEPATASRFHAPGEPKPRMLWQAHPPLARAFTVFPSHAAVCGFAFSPGGAFGHAGDAFVAEYGTFAPLTTGVNLAPAGFRVSRVDMRTRKVEAFARNDLPGPAYLNLQHGFNRPVDVLFATDSSLYVLDWGASTVDREGLKLVPRTGALFRIYAAAQAPLRPGGPINVPSAEVPRPDREPQVPNIPQAYEEAWPPLALIGVAVAAVILVVALAFRWVRRRRR